LPESLAQLLDTARHGADTLDQRLDHLLTHSSADTDDDTCIVGIHVIASVPDSTPPADETVEAGVDYDGHSSSIAAARTFVRDFLREADPDAPDDRRQHGAAALVTSELVTNVVRHAAGPFRLRLTIGGGFLEIAVSDRSADHPLSQPHDPRRIGQHGMEIVLALCESLRVEPSADSGKTVIARLSLR
jgi:anti-sigma regulatory factor (Ser/Thr protein kinase)